MYFSFIGRNINTITFMICSLITYLEINVPLQAKDKHITWRQIEKKVDSEITSTHNRRMGKPDDFIECHPRQTPHSSAQCLKSPFLAIARSDESTNVEGGSLNKWTRGPKGKNITKGHWKGKLKPREKGRGEENST